MKLNRLHAIAALVITLVLSIIISTSAQAQQTIGTYANARLNSYGHNRGFLANNGFYYMFAYNQANDIYYYYSQTQMSGNWTLGGSFLGNDVNTGQYAYGMDYDDSTGLFHFVWRDNTITADINYQAFSHNANGTLSSVAASAVAASPSPFSCDIVVMEDSDDLLLTWSNVGNGQVAYRTSSTANGTWTTDNGGLIVNTGWPNTWTSLVSLGGDRALLTYHYSNQYKARCQAYEGGVTDTWYAATGDMGFAQGNTLNSANIYGTDDVWITFQDEPGNQIEIWKYTWSSPSNTVTSEGTLSTPSTATYPVIQTDTLGNAYAYWLLSTQNYIMYNFHDGSSWESANGTLLLNEAAGITNKNYVMCPREIVLGDAGTYYFTTGNQLKWIFFYSQPEVTTLVPIEIDCTEITLRGEITDVGAAAIGLRGFYLDNDADHSDWYQICFDSGTYGTGIYACNFPEDDLPAEYGTVWGDQTWYYMARVVDQSAQSANGTWVAFTVSSCDAGANASAPYVPSGGVHVDTQVATSITTSSMVLNANITDIGNSSCTARGFYYGTTPDMLETWTEGGNFTAGTYNFPLSGLGTTVWYRAVAQNSAGVSLGAVMSATTLIDAPTCQTLPASSVTLTTARINSRLVDDGGASAAVNMRFQWWNAGNGTATDNQTAWVFNKSTGDYHWEDLSGLNANTTYAFRVLAQSAGGNCTGANETFTTPAALTDTPFGALAIPRLNENVIDIIWEPANDTILSEIRFLIGGTAPANYTQGTLVGITTGSAIEHTDLVPGVTYSYSIWGKSGSVYTDDYVSATATCSLTTDEGTMPDVDTGSWWTTTDYTLLENVPFFAQINDAADQIQISRNFFWILVCLVLGLIAYLAMLKMSGGNELVAAFAAGSVLFAGSGAGIVVPAMALPLGFIPIGITFLRSRIT